MAMLTVAQAADRLGLSAARVHQLIKDGVIKARKFGWQWAIDETDLGNATWNQKSGPKGKRK